MARLNNSIRYGGLLAIILFTVIAAGSQCQLDIRGPSPLFVKNFGSKKLAFRATNDVLNFDEHLTAYCNTKVSSNISFEFGKTTELFCNGKFIMYGKPEDEFFKTNRNRYIAIWCDPDSAWFNLFESSEQLPNCNSTTYGIGVEMPNATDIVAAGVCYDIAQLSLKYASYVAYKPSTYETTVMEELQKNKLMDRILNVVLYKRVENLNTYFSFMSPQKFNTTLHQMQSEEPLVMPFTFDYESLLQDMSLPAGLSDFSYIFNTMWLRQLRLGNWRFYLNALAKRAQDVTYIVYTGTHGRISIPDGKNNATLYVKADGARVDAPAYIWSYVRSLQSGVGEEFVVIAHNSPYEENPSSNAFCTDVCDEIEWLKNSDFSRMRRKPMLGYTFCCRPAEVAAVIDNFPTSRSKMLVPPTTITTTPTPESTESQGLLLLLLLLFIALTTRK